MDRLQLVSRAGEAVDTLLSSVEQHSISQIAEFMSKWLSLTSSVKSALAAAA